MILRASLCVLYLTTACTSGSYRYVDHASRSRVAHREVVRQAQQAGHSQVESDQEPVPRTGLLAMRGGGKNRQERLVQIKTVETENGSRTEIATTERSLRLECGGCTEAVSFPLEERSVQYEVYSLPDISVLRLDLVGDSEIAATMDWSLRYGTTLLSYGGREPTVSGRHRLRILASAGLGWGLQAKESSPSQSNKKSYSPTEGTLRAGVVLAHTYDRHVQPIPGRLLKVSTWALTTELSAEPYVGSRKGLDLTLAFRADPYGGVFARIGYEVEPEGRVTFGLGLEGGTWVGYSFAPLIAGALVAFGAQAIGGEGIKFFLPRGEPDPDQEASRY